MMESGYRKLIVWIEAKKLTVIVYRLTELFPKTEDFGLKSQMRRAVVSVISNFVEGYLKTSKKHKASFLEIAQTSLQELEAQGEICRILDYWAEEDYKQFEGKRGEIGFLLFRYCTKLQQS